MVVDIGLVEVAASKGEKRASEPSSAIGTDLSIPEAPHLLNRHSRVMGLERLCIMMHPFALSFESR